MAPWDQLSTKDRNMVHSKIEMLFELMCKCRIRIPLKILLLLDQKILKIEPEMAELAIPKSVLFGHNIRSKINQFRTSFDFEFRRHILGLRAEKW